MLYAILHIVGLREGGDSVKARLYTGTAGGVGGLQFEG